MYSTIYYDPGFQLGEDVRSESRIAQDNMWKDAVQDGRAHVSHREATFAHADRLATAISSFHEVETIADCMLGENGIKSHMRRLDKYMGFIIVEFLHGSGHGFLLTAAVSRRQQKRDMISAKQYNDFSFRLSVRKRPLLSFEILDSNCKTFTNDAALHIPYDACCANLNPKGYCLCLHDGKLARHGRRLSMQHHFFFANRVWSELDNNEAFCKEELLPLLEHILPGQGLADKRATLICFGQTGTGKTYTLRSCLHYLAKVLMGNDKQSHNITQAYAGCQVHLKFFEVHGKKCHDLLNQRKEVKLLADSEDCMHLRGAECIVLDSTMGGDSDAAAEQREKYMMSCLASALELRSSQVTERNPISSRSHAVCELTIRFSQNNRSGSISQENNADFNTEASHVSIGTGTIRLVDLAGSERNYETVNMSAKQHAESADINSALMALKDCFRAASAVAKGAGLSVSAGSEDRKNGDKNRTSGDHADALKSSRISNSSKTDVMHKIHIPFRAHMLTRVLKDCFVAPTSRTTVVATVCPSPIDLVHSLNTLEHAILMNPILESYKTRVAVDIPVVDMTSTFEPMEKWTCEHVQAWLATVDNGRFSMLQVPRELDGKGLCSLNSGSLSALFEGTLRQARIGGEGSAWVVGTAESSAHSTNPTNAAGYAAYSRWMWTGFVSMDDDMATGVESVNGGNSITHTAHGTVDTNTIARALWSAIRRERAAIARRLQSNNKSHQTK